jgi:hypothetical protein
MFFALFRIALSFQQKGPGRWTPCSFNFLPFIHTRLLCWSTQLPALQVQPRKTCFILQTRGGSSLWLESCHAHTLVWVCAGSHTCLTVQWKWHITMALSSGCAIHNHLKGDEQLGSPVIIIAIRVAQVSCFENDKSHRKLCKQ